MPDPEARPPAAPASATAPVLEARGIRKSFGPVTVLEGIDLELRPGEVHAILGENGAGKSTLMKILAGHLAPDGGEVRYRGAPARWGSGAEAEAAGLVLIHQEFNLAPDLTVEENVFLGRELRRGPWLDRRRMREEAARLLAELDTPIDPRTRLRDLSVSSMQMVEIAKALARDARVLFMDEPTDVLTGAETEVLFERIRRLAAGGVAVVYVSHKLGEITEIADRATILRDGERVATRDVAGLPQDEMARLMVGRELADLYPPKGRGAGEVALEVRSARVPGAVSSASFTLRRGEVLGFAGLVGAGRTELFEGLLGLRPAELDARLHGEPFRPRRPDDARRAGIAYLSEDRKGKGLLVSKSIAWNVSLASLERFASPLLDHRAEREDAAAAMREHDVRAPGPDAPVGSLSGGNQQKVALAKMLRTSPEVIVLDEPTRGIDVGTRQQVYRLVRELADAGKAVALISSEMNEIIGLSDRVVVMRAGRTVGTLEGGRVREEEIVRYATGLAEDPPPGPDDPDPETRPGGTDHAA